MKIIINITRHRHSYLHTITRNGVQERPAEIDRIRAEEIIRVNCDGHLPAECNLDVTTPRRWVWQVEVETANVQ